MPKLFHEIGNAGIWHLNSCVWCLKCWRFVFMKLTPGCHVHETTNGQPGFGELNVLKWGLVFELLLFGFITVCLSSECVKCSD